MNLRTFVAALTDEEIRVLVDEINRVYSIYPKATFAPLSVDEMFDELPKTHLNLSLEERRFISTNQYLVAIKTLRGRTGMSLKAAKDIVDEYRQAHFPQYTDRGF